MTNEVSANKAYLKRTEARLAVVQAFYQVLQSKEPHASVYTNFLASKLYQDDGEHPAMFDVELFRSIFFATDTYHEKIEDLIAQNLSQDWTYERLDLVLICILHAAIAEFFCNQTIAAAIVINEYVNITRFFYKGKEAKFINGMLDKIARQLSICMRDDKNSKELKQFLQKDVPNDIASSVHA